MAQHESSSKTESSCIRCSWVPKDDALYQKYHDEEWGRAVYDDGLLFEMLILEGMQAGLSWRTVLERRPLIKKAFCNLDPIKLVNLSDEELTVIMNKPGVIRHRLKTFGVRKNAKSFLDIQKKKGSFSKYLWNFVDHTPLIGKRTPKGINLAQTPLSQAISKDLKKWGFTFVGPTIVYAYMQAVGLVNDHDRGCFKAPSLDLI